MRMSCYFNGTSVRLSATFKNDQEALADPTAVTFKIRVEAGDPTTYVYGADLELVRDGLGLYHVDWPIAADGRHYWRWDGDGAVDAAIEGSFMTQKSAF